MRKRTLTLRELVVELPKVIEFARVDRDYIVIVETLDNHYVQMAFPATWILGEAVSNEYIQDEAKRISEHDEVLLDILGWERPGATDRDGATHRNFHRAWHDDTPSDVIADDLIRTLTGVYARKEAMLVRLDVFTTSFNQTVALEDRSFGDGMEGDDDAPPMSEVA